MSILAKIIPKQIDEKCLDTIALTSKEDNVIGTNIFGSSFVIEYPVGNTLPLAGGAIISISAKNLKIELSSSANDILEKSTRNLDGLIFGNTITDLVNARLAVNSTLLGLSKKNIKIGTSKKHSPPSIYFNILHSSADKLSDGVFSPDLNRICEFKFVPYTIFSKITENLIKGDIKNTVGVSGITFSDLHIAASGLGTSSFRTQDILDLVMEFFTISNISDDEISKRVGNPSVSGFYTIFNDKVYIKLPDLTGRDSAGNSDFIINSSSNLYLEILFNGELTRIKVDNFSIPPLAVVLGDTFIDIPRKGELEIKLSLAEDSDGLIAYLSPTTKDSTLMSTNIESRNLTIQQGYAEIFSVPMLTKNIFGLESRKSTSSSISAINLDNLFWTDVSNKILKYFPKETLHLEELKINSPEDIGYPFFGSPAASSYFGELNRPEILLGDLETGLNNGKSDLKYYNLGSSSIFNILSSIRPKIYKDIPALWIKTPLVKNNDDSYSAKFSSDNFKDIDLSDPEFGGNIQYALYIGDQNNQVTRVPNGLIVLSEGSPYIEDVTPNGSRANLLIDDLASFVITGEHLDSVSSISFQIYDLTQDAKTYRIGSSDDHRATIISSKEILIEFNKSLSSLNFSSDSFYKVFLNGNNTDNTSNFEYIRISESSQSAIPIFPAHIASFKLEEFSSIDFKGTPLYGIPLLKDGQSAKIKLKSKGKLFSGKYPLFAYIGFDESDKDTINMFCNADSVHTMKSDLGNIVIPLNVKYELSKQPSSDFYASSSRVGILQFPGKSFSSFNFSKLSNLNKAYIIITSAPILTLQLTESSSNHGIITIGGTDSNNNQYPPFVEPSVVLGLAADTGKSDSVSSTFESGEFNGAAKEIFAPKSLNVENISSFNKIERLLVVFSGINERLLKSKYKIMANDEEISKFLSSKIKIGNYNGKTSNLILYTLDNVVLSSDGAFSVYIEKKDRIFDVTYNSKNVIRQGTLKLYDGDYSFDTETHSIELLNNLDSIVGSDGTNILDAIYPEKFGGVLFNPIKNTTSIFSLFNEIEITPNISIQMGFGSGTELESISTNETRSEVLNMARDLFLANAGSVFNLGSYTLNSSNTSALAFFNISNSGGASIRYNIVEIVKVVKHGSVKEFVDGDTDFILESGEQIYVFVKNLRTKHAVVKINDTTITPTEIVDDGGHGRYRLTIKVPQSLSGTVFSLSKPIVICTSTSNADRNKAKSVLGRSFVLDIDKEFDDILFGPLKDKLPDVEAIKNKILDFPLRFINIPLNNSQVPIQDMKSFCDFSFHLAADLKIALNGFQVLMVPVQIIFCIIDVICSLMNPVKIAKAVIRLFQCLYDLILLLPQISVPVMFFQTIVHLLELFECVISKILLTINTVNEIIGAINTAINEGTYASIKSLEEALSEHLFEITIDLQFLDPIVSILAIFLQLLQLAFRFPCSVNPGDGGPDCGIDGTMLAGIVAGIIAPESVIITDTLIPLAQSYSVASDGVTTSGDIEIAALSDIVARKTSTQAFLESINADSDSLRGTSSGSNGITFNATFAPTFTKSTKKAGKHRTVEFKFKNRAESSTLKKKYIDPNQTIDSPLGAFSIDNNFLKVTANGNLYSPIDSAEFLNISGNSASVKPLTLILEIPIMSVDSVTGFQTQTGVQNIDRTFDGIPMMAIMDDDFNLYFIDEDGIKFDSNGMIDSITATVVNQTSATKLKFSKEDEEVDTDDDGILDDEVKIFDFPQLYFFDMRQAGEQISSFCNQSSINSFAFNPSDSTDNNDIIDIVDSSKTCLEVYISGVKSLIQSVRDQQSNGDQHINIIDTSAFEQLNQDLKKCMGTSVDDVCRFVVNSLNTSFKISEDSDQTALTQYTSGSIDPSLLDGFNEIPPDITGAQEYASGIGDSATISVDKFANIIIIPRDSYDAEIAGDFSNKIKVEIISDTTGSAELIVDGNSSYVSKNGNQYTVKLKANNIGEVKVKASICNRTIQAITFSGIEQDVAQQDIIDCIPSAIPLGGEQVTPIGALVKVDRILTVFFVQKTSSFVSDTNGDSAKTNPQMFGTILEN